MPRRTLRARINAGGCRNEGGCSPPAATQGVHCQSTVERSCHVPQDAAHQPVRHRAARGGGPAPRGAPRFGIEHAVEAFPALEAEAFCSCDIAVVDLRLFADAPGGARPSRCLADLMARRRNATRHVLQRRGGRCRRRRGGMLDAGGLRGVRRAVDATARRDAGRFRARPAAALGETRRRPVPRAAVPRHRHRLHTRARVVSRTRAAPTSR